MLEWETQTHLQKLIPPGKKKQDMGWIGGGAWWAGRQDEMTKSWVPP